MPIEEKAKPLNILLVEDNEDDIEITEITFKRSRIINNLYVVRDGEQAWEYLSRKGDYQDTAKYPEPQLILLDINMPKIGGFELLERIKKTDSLKLIPVVMLTSSKSDEDIIRGYGDGAAAYIAKPVAHDEFLKIVDTFNFFWQIVKLPR